jgi:transcriptional activator SPT8
VRPPSPAALRRAQILSSIAHPRSYTVEAICAIPHPGPTHCISASMCFTHLLTGSQDGYVRNYDIFTAANSKNFLTSVQRAHCNVMEGSMKAGQLRYWWENPALSPEEFNPNMSQPDLGPIFSIATHSDALWTLTGSDVSAAWLHQRGFAADVGTERPHQSLHDTTQSRPALLQLRCSPGRRIGNGAPA